MVCLRDVVSAVALLVALVAPGMASAQGVQHSGVLLDVDAESGTITLAELAREDPVDAEMAVIIVRIIAVPTDTPSFRVRRVPPDVLVEDGAMRAIRGRL
jgi:hypothetical protein